MEPAKLLQFPSKMKKKKIIKNIDGIKYYNQNQIKLIRRTVRDTALLDIQKNKVTGIREWMCIDLLTSSGIRVSECSNIRCGDALSKYGESSIFVREGKGSRSRTVQIPVSLKKHLKQFITWKKEHNEPIDNDAFLFIGQRGPISSQGIQQVVKKYLKALNLYENGKSVHALRHSYAVEFYRKEKDLRALQKQLGHASIQTTQIYADVLAEDIQDQIKGLWN